MADEELARRQANEEVALYEATALSLEESRLVSNAYPTRVVVLLGERDAGKTTLLAEIHHAYLRAPFAGHLFAGSKTLIGLEERCFLSRFKSGQATEDTERTKYAGVRLLHIALAPEAEPDLHSHLLLTDISGELFKEIRGNIDEARELAPLIRRAEHVVLLVDGDRLSMAKTRLATETNTCVLLRCLLEAGGLQQAGSLDIVISKWDYVVHRSAEARVAQLELAARGVTVPLVPRFHHVAARITNPVDLPAGFGMADLVDGWTRQPMRSASALYNNAAQAAPGRWYQRYRFPPRIS